MLEEKNQHLLKVLSDLQLRKSRNQILLEEAQKLKSKELNIPIESEPPVEDIRVVVGVDFGTTFSGFSYAFVSKNSRIPQITVNSVWHGDEGPSKINTALRYDEDYENVITWGSKAYINKDSNKKSKLIELSKLYLGDVPEEEKLKFPEKLTLIKAITDYFREMGKTIQEEIKQHWPDIDFYRHVRIVVAVPAEFTEDTKTIMRQCLYNANIIKRIDTLRLRFTTEPEAALIYCMSKLTNHGLTTGAESLIVDCGGETVDLTVIKLLSENQLKEITSMRTSEFCGGSYVDKSFLEFFENKIVGKSAMEKLKENNYDQVNNLVQYFCRFTKTLFTGDESDFDPFEFDIERWCPGLMEYVTGPQKEKLVEDDGIVELDFETIKSFFDKAIELILISIEKQLVKCTNCSVMLLVGGFSGSKYLRLRVKQKFESQIKIAVPPRPIIAIVEGACKYGLNMEPTQPRVLKWTYGVKIEPKWQAGDPPSRKVTSGRISKFSAIVKRGTVISATDQFSIILSSLELDTTIEIYYTSKDDATYCDEPEMNYLGQFEIDPLDVHLGANCPVLVTLHFGYMEIFVTAKNETNGKVYTTSFYNRE